VDGKMLLAIAAVLAGTLLSLASSLAAGDASSSSSDTSLYLVGVGLALLSTALSAAVCVVEELVFAQHRRVDPLHFAAAMSVFGTLQIAAALLAAQFIRGNDHGVQVLPRPARPRPGRVPFRPGHGDYES
jgi:drug/metabolite transporter (DMT)-like permease